MANLITHLENVGRAVFVPSRCYTAPAMAASGDNEGPVGYRWPGADEAELDAACARIARQIALGHARMVGVLPVFGGVLAAARRSPGPEVELGPLLERLASSLAGFVGGTVGFVRSFR